MKRFTFITVNTKEEIVPGLHSRMFIILEDGTGRLALNDFIAKHTVESISGVTTSDIETVKKWQAKWNTFAQLMTDGTRATV